MALQVRQGYGGNLIVETSSREQIGIVSTKDGSILFLDAKPLKVSRVDAARMVRHAVRDYLD